MEPNALTHDVRPVSDGAAPAPQLLRLSDPAYSDGVWQMREGPSVAEVARVIFDQDGSIPEPNGLSMMWVIWGQFLDHDIDLTTEQHGGTETLHVPGLVTPFSRSDYDHATGHDPDAPRQQVNLITPFVDASNIYGSDSGRLAALRAWEGGRMAVSDGNGDGVDHLPLNGAGLPNAGEGDTPFYLAGDVRANENPALTAMHTLWVNEHNYWAGRLAEDHPDWDDETLFQGARAIVETLVQKVTYDEFLPHLVGDDLGPLGEAAGPVGIFTEFSTAAYRFGHSMVAPELTVVGEDGTGGNSLDLASALFNPEAFGDAGVASLLRGIAENPAQRLDAQVVDQLNQFFDMGGGTMVGFSLPALNLLRGRDHGIDTYLAVRAAVLGDVDGTEDFDAITSDPALQAKLRQIYGTADKVDLWVGGLAEDRADGALVGPLFQAIIAEQFRLLRDGDPYWHERRDWTDPGLHAEVEKTSFADILMRSGGIGHMQRDAFLASERHGGTDGHDMMHGDQGRDLMIGFEGHDRLFGHDGDDDLFGDAGHDSMWGGDGNDGMTGGEGHDRMWGGDGDDEMDGSAGHDRMMGGAGADSMEGGAGHDRMLGGSGADNIDAGGDHDRAWGEGGDDTILLGAGDDRGWGGWGDDTLDGGSGRDVLLGDRGSDSLRGGDDDDRLFGGVDGDVLQGDGGNDRLWGQDGDDTLEGGDGFDLLWGGRGADTFVFRFGEAGHDRIFGFDAGADTFEMSGFGAGVGFNDLTIGVSGGRTSVSFDGDLIFAVEGRIELADGDFLFTG